jgi:MFS transporter, putative metabolite:H+ symporter
MTGTIAAHSDQERADIIAARVENLPSSRWHTQVRLLLGTAIFFDSWDIVLIGYVMPTLVGQWHLTPAQVGWIISSGFLGQFFGAVTFGFLGERFGRTGTLKWTLLLLSIGGIAGGFSTSVAWLMCSRFIQGLGIGGELPLGATYVNEVAKAKSRGVFVMLFQLIAPISTGLTSLIAVWVVGHLGWQWMFFIGSVPVLLTIPMRWIVPESPRWLARQGRLAEADAVMSSLEARVAASSRQPIPPLPAVIPHEVTEKSDWRGLFRRRYLGRTLVVWAIWSTSLTVGYGLATWLPTIFRTIYKLPIKDALLFGSAGNLLHMVATIGGIAVVDRWGRRPVFIGSFAMSSAALIALWALSGSASPAAVMVLAGIGGSMMAVPQVVMWVYAPEVYPTRMRALGTGFGSSVGRLGNALIPLAIGYLLPLTGVNGVFALFSGLAIFGTVIVVFFALERKGMVLEESGAA